MPVKPFLDRNIRYYSDKLVNAKHFGGEPELFCVVLHNLQSYFCSAAVHNAV